MYFAVQVEQVQYGMCMGECRKRTEHAVYLVHLNQYREPLVYTGSFSS